MTIKKQKNVIVSPFGDFLLYQSEDGETNYRSEVSGGDCLALAQTVGRFVSTRQVPPPVNYKHCEGYSLKESCLPAVVADKGRNRKAARECL